MTDENSEEITTSVPAEFSTEITESDVVIRFDVESRYVDLCNQIAKLKKRNKKLARRIARLESGQFNEQAFAALDDSVKRELLGIPDEE